MAMVRCVLHNFIISSSFIKVLYVIHLIYVCVCAIECGVRVLVKVCSLHAHTQSLLPAACLILLTLNVTIKRVSLLSLVGISSNLRSWHSLIICSSFLHMFLAPATSSEPNQIPSKWISVSAFLLSIFNSVFHLCNDNTIVASHFRWHSTKHNFQFVFKRFVAFAA